MDEARLKRLRFRAWRRGFREADLIFGPFADNRAQNLTASQVEAFEALLDEPDHDAFEWVVGGLAPEPYETAIVGLIRAFHALKGPTPDDGIELVPH
jgi:antitoxin CptB